MPARFDAGQQRRRAMLAKVHLAKKQLGLSDDDYRAVLMRVAGAMSAADLDERGLAAVIAEFSAKGFTAKARFPGQSRAADHPSARKARALWISLHQLGEIKNPSEPALEAFAARQMRVERLQWANQGQCYKLIEALKAIATRAGWDQSTEGLSPAARPRELKRRLCVAIMDRLRDRGVVPAGWTLAQACFRLGGVELPDAMLRTAEDYDRAAFVLGHALNSAS